VTSIEDYIFYQCSSLTNVTIPDSVVSIGSSIFYACKSLKSVFYQGYHIFPSSNVFSSCYPDIVCVPPYYSSGKFCGLNTTSNDTTCIVFQNKFDNCCKGAFINDTVVQQKRRNATEWERLSSGCATYVCHNESGLIAWSECNSTEDVTKMCTSGMCTEKKKSVSNKVVVDVELDGGVLVNEVNASYLQEWISAQSGIEVKDFSFGWETDENGRIVHVFVFANESTDRLQPIALGRT